MEEVTSKTTAKWITARR